MQAQKIDYATVQNLKFVTLKATLKVTLKVVLNCVYKTNLRWILLNYFYESIKHACHTDSQIIR